MPTRHPEVGNQLVQDRNKAKDLDAYKRLRKEGHQPKATKGAHDIETMATEKFEIESGRILGPSMAKRTQKAHEEIQQGGANATMH